jgi:Tol biopolymer transport system component
MAGDFLLPAFGKFGKRVVAGTGLSDLVIADVVLGQSRVLFHRDRQGILGAQWSRDDSIVFAFGSFFGSRDGGAQVALINADGSGFRQLTSGPNDNGFPSMAPNGKRIVYRTFGPEGQGLRVLDLETNSVAVLTTDYDNFPVWSPRGDLIVFVRRYMDDYEIFAIKPDGTSLWRLTTFRGNDGHVAVSPDGKWIAFSSSHMGFKDEALYTDNSQPYGELFVMRYDGTHIQQLTDNQWEDAGPAWWTEFHQPVPVK